MSDIAIRVDNLGKEYRIGSQQASYRTIRETMMDAFQAPFERAGKLLRGQASGATNLNETIWALKDVSFEIRQGEVVGVIGRNGAGKSTLLKILSRITEPTTGRVELHGRVGSLLEVGTGFHPELTGRENIYLNGAILGMSRNDIERQFDEIVAFAEVEKFIDTPVKHYSSGMYLRLAFAVAAHLEPEILLVDEVLAVGDVAFQKKCLGKMGEVAGLGRTVLFVSHNMGAIRGLCPDSLLLSEGQVACQGETSHVVAAYLAGPVTDQHQSSEISWQGNERPGTDEIHLDSIRLIGPHGLVQNLFDQVTPIGVEIAYTVHSRLTNMRLVVQLINEDSVTVLASTDHMHRPPVTKPGVYCSLCQIPALLLNSGMYRIRLNAGIPGSRILIPSCDYLELIVEAGDVHGSQYRQKWPGVVAPRLEWRLVQQVATGGQE